MPEVGSPILNRVLEQIECSLEDDHREDTVGYIHHVRLRAMECESKKVAQNRSS